ncbi:MAG: hypothetical protein RLZZ143_2803 [Cyanobacteriota bacterium]|jgi:hypothetical protein
MKVPNRNKVKRLYWDDSTWRVLPPPTSREANNSEENCQLLLPSNLSIDQTREEDSVAQIDN